MSERNTFRPRDEHSGASRPAMGAGGALPSGSGGVTRTSAHGTDGRGSFDHADDDEVLTTTGRDARRGSFGPAGGAGMPAEQSRDPKAALRRLWQIVRPERWVLTVALTLTIGSVILVVLGPRLLGRVTDVIVDGVVAGREGGQQQGGIDFGALHRQLLVVAAIYLGSWVLGFAQAYLLAGVLQRSMFRLRQAVEQKLHALPISYIDRHERGDVLSRVTNDIDNLSQSLQQTSSQIVTSVLTLIGVTVMMFIISPLLAAVALVTVPTSVWLMKVISGRARPRFMSQWRHTGNLNAQAEEIFTGHAIVKTFGRQHDVEARFRGENEDLFEASRSAQFTASLIQPAIMFMGNIQFAIIAVVGGLRISSGAITVGDMQAMIQYARNFAFPLTHIASMAATFQSGLASLERVVELLDADEQVPDPAPTRGDAGARPVQGRIAFDDVHFSYDPDQPLIEGLSLVAEPGQTVAVVGPTGAGKTTLVNLLMRFYELDSGRITIDGRDITSMPRHELRSKIGMVLQDTWLFGGTIRDNLAYGRPNATDDEIHEAARIAYVDRFVHSLPDGYDTVINDEGDNISAGEKQLMTIARAFLSNPSILILDEATSSVDTRTEVLIQEAMNRLRSERTSFVIAHRLSTIRGADTILVMDGGRIVEQGNHDQLIARDGAYASLHHAQFAGRDT